MADLSACGLVAWLRVWLLGVGGRVGGRAGGWVGGRVGWLVDEFVGRPVTCQGAGGRKILAPWNCALLSSSCRPLFEGLL